MNYSLKSVDTKCHELGKSRARGKNKGPVESLRCGEQQPLAFLISLTAAPHCDRVINLCSFFKMSEDPTCAAILERK